MINHLIVMADDMSAHAELGRLIKTHVVRFSHSTATCGNEIVRVIGSRDRDERILGMEFQVVSIAPDVPESRILQYLLRRRST